MRTSRHTALMWSIGLYAQWFTIDEFLDALLVMFPGTENVIEAVDNRPSTQARHAIWTVSDRDGVVASGQAVIKWRYIRMRTPSGKRRVIGGSRFDGLVLA